MKKVIVFFITFSAYVLLYFLLKYIHVEFSFSKLEGHLLFGISGFIFGLLGASFYEKYK